MKNSIAIAAALGVVAFFFGQELFSAFAGEPKPAPEKDSAGLISFSFNFRLPTLNNGAVADRAWSVFVEYREFAKEGDLEGVKSLSHQVSDTCLDPGQREECNALMQSVYLFTDGWQWEEFPNVAYDDKQIVLSTGFLQVLEDGTSAETVILFTRTPAGVPKVLGIKFCAGADEDTANKCVDTDPATRDSDDDGWWDDIEERFYR